MTHRAEKGTLPESTSKLLSNAEQNFLQTLKMDGVEETKKQYKPSYYRTLKRRLVNKYMAANTLVREVKRCGILND